MRFNDIKKGEKYGYGGWSLATVSAERVFNLFFEFIEEIIRTPYDRRVTQLFYNGEWEQKLEYDNVENLFWQVCNMIGRNSNVSNKEV